MWAERSSPSGSACAKDAFGADAITATDRGKGAGEGPVIPVTGLATRAARAARRHAVVTVLRSPAAAPGLAAPGDRARTKTFASALAAGP